MIVSLFLCLFLPDIDEHRLDEQVECREMDVPEEAEAESVSSHNTKVTTHEDVADKRETDDKRYQAYYHKGFQQPDEKASEDKALEILAVLHNQLVSISLNQLRWRGQSYRLCQP